MAALARYHRWRIVGVENVPVRGGMVVTGTHSLATYDLFLMGAASRRLIGRQAHIVGDDLMFRFASRETLHEIGLVPGGRERVVRRLQEGGVIGIAPGGMKESLRPSGQTDAFDWSGRRGFVWVAMKAGVPIVPSVCPSANEIFTVYGNPMTRWAYGRFRVPLPVFRGLGPTVVPRPVPLTSVIGQPLYPRVLPESVDAAAVDEMHARVIEATRRLSAEVRAAGRAIRRGKDVWDFWGRPASDEETGEKGATRP